MSHVEKVRMILAAVCVAMLVTPALASYGYVPTAEWRTVASWKGEGIKDTETFSVQSREWRITWETKNEKMAGASIIQIYVYNEKDELVTLAANKQGVGKDTSYVRGQGKFYLKINSANVEWSVLVEDQR